MLKTYSLPILAVWDPMEVRSTMPTARSRKMRNGSDTRLDANRMWWTMPPQLDWQIFYFARESWTYLILGCATVNPGEFPIDVDVGTGHFTVSLDIRLCLAEPIEKSYLLLIKPYSAYYSTIFLGRAKRFLNGFFLQGHWCAAVCRDVHPSFTRHCARGSWYPANRIFRGRLQCFGQN